VQEFQRVVEEAQQLEEGLQAQAEYLVVGVVEAQ
jgi:hypothetical protein